MSHKQSVVLIVEDEAEIRFNTLDALEDIGHTVLEAANADEAIILLRNRSDIEVVFTDVNMAGSMDGLQLARRVRAMRPGLGIIITSGLVRLDPMLLPARTVYLPKPYQFSDLFSAIDQITD